MKLLSNEMVFKGHPDKVCDQISDALLNAYLKGDNASRCAIECVGGKHMIFITGEVTSNATVDAEEVVKQVLAEVNYPNDCKIINNIGIQSVDIALGTNDNIGGAGDQGVMYGYACNETPQMYPKAMVIINDFVRYYNNSLANKDGFLSDGKCQITGKYEDGKLIGIDTFLVSYQNTEENREYTDQIIKDKINSYDVKVDKILINPTGKFKIGGFIGDSGLTGRKIVCDNYQSFCHVGGGCFSGKDPSKVDRSASFGARELAKDLLTQFKLQWCKVQLAYAIGVAEPVSINVECDKSNINFKIGKSRYTPKAMIERFDLKHLDYQKLAVYGIYGFDGWNDKTI